MAAPHTKAQQETEGKQSPTVGCHVLHDLSVSVDRMSRLPAVSEQVGAASSGHGSIPARSATLELVPTNAGVQLLRSATAAPAAPRLVDDVCARAID